MDNIRITGVQHVAIGVRNIEAIKCFYQDVLNCTKLYVDFGEVWNSGPDFFRTSPHAFKGLMIQQEIGGIVVECIQLVTPMPRPIHREIKFGDIGVNKMTVEVSDVEKFYQEYRNKMCLFFEPRTTVIPGWGEYNFVYGSDPEGNLLEFISSPHLKVENIIGKICSLGLSVTDLDRSIAFYQKYLGLDTMVIQPHDKFSGLLDDLSGGNSSQVRSCLLANSIDHYMLEIYEVSRPRGRSLPFHALWGDYGYLETAYLTDDIFTLTKYYLNEGLEFICNPTSITIYEKRLQGFLWFMYIRDPDGIPVEIMMEPK